jgi:SAM-dependent methyltransferase
MKFSSVILSVIAVLLIANLISSLTNKPQNSNTDHSQTSVHSLKSDKTLNSGKVSSRSQWLKNSQEGEFQFWMSHWDSLINFRSKEVWMKDYTDFFFQRGGFDTTKDFIGKTVVDIGSGPRPLAFAMRQAKIFAIEPLGSRFLEACQRIPRGSPDFLELQKVEKVFSVAAEDFVEELNGQADFVLSTNSLDHTWDPIQYLTNAMKYLKAGGKFLLVVDLHFKTEDMHPQKSLLPSIISQVYSAGLKFERGSCVVAPSHPALAFNACWMVLSINNHYRHETIA